MTRTSEAPAPTGGQPAADATGLVADDALVRRVGNDRGAGGHRLVAVRGSAHRVSGSGRRPQNGEVPYVLPRHPSEIDRLDVQHYALREALGTNHLASVETPARVLDVGAGTGQWAFEVCAEFPGALVVGLDLVAGKPGGPANYRIVLGNLLEGLPFERGAFDFVHQRLLFSGVPVKSWPAVVGELVRVTHPGGWVELVEGNVEFERAGPASERLAEMLRRLSRTRGLDSTGSSSGRWTPT